jgi:hypothetical protein
MGTTREGGVMGLTGTIFAMITIGCGIRWSGCHRPRTKLHPIRQVTDSAAAAAVRRRHSARATDSGW